MPLDEYEIYEDTKCSHYGSALNKRNFTDDFELKAKMACNSKNNCIGFIKHLDVFHLCLSPNCISRDMNPSIRSHRFYQKKTQLGKEFEIPKTEKIIEIIQLK